ncbi:uncharacterized protein LOC144931716 [Lampetra fluviatilis]
MEKKKMILLLFLSFVALAKSEMAMPSTEKFYEDLLDEYDFSGSGFSTDDEGGDEGELYSGSGDLSEQDQGWNVHTPHKGEKMVTNPTMVLPTTTQNRVKLLVGESAEDYPEESGSAGETGTETPSDPWIQRGLAPEGSSPYDVSAHKTHGASLLDRTEVLAAIIAGGAVGLLFAVFLILFLVYRMRKKEAGSFSVAGPLPYKTNLAYQKAPNDEGPM